MSRNLDLQSKSLAERIGIQSSRNEKTGCMEWSGPLNKWGYGNIKDRSRTRAAHRVAYELAHGPIPDGLFVLHRCDNPACIEVGHLFLGTHADNMQDCSKKGRFSFKGAGNNKARLVDSDVMEIRRLANEGESYEDIATRFQITSSHARRIALGEAWSHLPGKAPPRYARAALSGEQS